MPLEYRPQSTPVAGVHVRTRLALRAPNCAVAPTAGRSAPQHWCRACFFLLVSKDPKHPTFAGACAALRGVLACGFHLVPPFLPSQHVGALKRSVAWARSRWGACNFNHCFKPGTRRARRGAVWVRRQQGRRRALAASPAVHEVEPPGQPLHCTTSGPTTLEPVLTATGLRVAFAKAAAGGERALRIQRSRRVQV